MLLLPHQWQHHTLDPIAIVLSCPTNDLKEIKLNIIWEQIFLNNLSILPVIITAGHYYRPWGFPNILQLMH